MSSPTEQLRTYATKTATATSNFNAPGSNGDRFNGKETIYCKRLLKK